MANIIEINNEDFGSLINNSNELVVVDFWAPWCGPCRKLAPLLEQIQSEFNDKIKIVKIDADKNTENAQKYGVISLPSVLIFKNGDLKEVMAGMMAKSAIVSNIKKYL